MLSYLRKHASTIMVVTVVLFALSIIIPAVIYNPGKRGPSRQAARQLSGGALGHVDGTPIDPRKFMQVVNQRMASVTPPQQKSKAEPRIAARIMYESLMQTVDHMLLLREAKKRHIRVSGGEIGRQLDAVKKSYNITDNGALKELLRRNGYTLAQFKQMVKDEMMVQKMVADIQNAVTVTDEDVKVRFKKVKAQHILIKPDYQEAAGNKAAMLKAAEEAALRQAEGIYERLLKGESFTKLAKEYSGDEGSAAKGGELGWVEQGQMVPEFEAALFALKPGEISKPVKTVFGYHIIKAEDVQAGEVPIDIDENEMKKTMLEQKKRGQMDNWYAHLLKGADIQIEERSLLAYKYKAEGDYDKALREYRLLASNNPADPIGNVLIGEVYEQMGKWKEANEEYQKALLKVKISPALDNPTIHLARGSFELKRGEQAAGVKELKKAEALAGDNLAVYALLKQEYENYGYSSEGKRLARKIEQIQTLFSADIDKDLSKLSEGSETAKPALEQPPLPAPMAPETVLPPIEKPRQ